MLISGFSDIPWEASGLPIFRDFSVTGLRKIFFKYHEGFHWEWGVLKKGHIPKTQLSGLLIFFKKKQSAERYLQDPVPPWVSGSCSLFCVCS